MHVPSRRVVWLLSVVSLAALACSQEPATPGGGTGGSGAQGSGGRGGSSGGGSGGNSAGQGGSGGSATTTGGASGTGGSSAGSGGSGTGSGGSSAGSGGAPADAAPGGDTAGPATGEKFSFFVASLAGMQRLSKSPKGFGGDLRYGQPDGISGADKICTELAEGSLAGSGAKGWRAFLSAQMGPGGMPVDAIDRIGEGPWYDRKGRVVAMNKAALINSRPMGADPAIINDLPNETGVGNHRPDPGMPAVDNHHVLTGSNTMGRLNGPTSTCNSWTALTNAGRPRIGFSWPAGGRLHWISGQDEGGCGAGVNIGETGGSDPSNPIVGSGGGYGGIYCFALKP